MESQYPTKRQDPFKPSSVEQILWVLIFLLVLAVCCRDYFNRPNAPEAPRDQKEEPSTRTSSV